MDLNAMNNSAILLSELGNQIALKLNASDANIFDVELFFKKYLRKNMKILNYK